MVAGDLTQFALYLVALSVLAPPLGTYMASVYEGRQRWLVLVERFFYRIVGTAPEKEQHWTRYALSVLAFNLVGFFMVYAILRLQGILPFNPAHKKAVPPDLAFNTAVSFITNTNWQAYGGETTMSYLSQMLGLTVQNFVSASTGMGVAIAVIRGFVRRKADTVGNFWADLTRGTLYILLPLSLIIAVFLVSQGTPQDLAETNPPRVKQGCVACPRPPRS